ncbi:MAG TPA: zinc chelation protein SecC [Campylobacteraceae bacterium]|nr:zinc chelation protein SecC [Campylobacteraceae bacterium]
MAKLSPNAACPCGSGKKYKKCCRPYHLGARPADALALMKSRYSAYAAGESGYIVKTTHPDNPDFTEARAQWLASIDTFCKKSSFEGLEIVSFEAGAEEAFVTFIARLGEGELRERSRFRKQDGVWLYLDGTFF